MRNFKRNATKAVWQATPGHQGFCRGTWEPGYALAKPLARSCFDENQELEGVSPMSVRKALVQDIHIRTSTRQKAKI